MNKENADKNFSNDSIRKKFDEYINRVKTGRPKNFAEEPEGVINTVLDNNGGENEKW